MADILSACHAECVSIFDRVLQALQTLPPGLSGHGLDIALQNEFGRYKVWAGNVGAAHHGRTYRISLDYRLKDASFYRDRVLELLQDLLFTLQKLMSILKGERLPFEKEQVSAESESDLSNLSSDANDSNDSSSSSSSSDNDYNTGTMNHIRALVATIDPKPTTIVEDLDLPAEQLKKRLRPSTELGLLQGAIIDIVNSLYKIATVIRRPTPSDRHTRSKEVDVHHFAEYDARYVCDKFPLASGEIAARLSKGITRRRQLLKYRASHNKSLISAVKLHEPTDAGTEVRRVEFAVPTTRKMKIEKAHYVEGYESTVQSSYFNPSTKASTFVPQMPRAMEEVQSVADTVSSRQSGQFGHENIRVPPRPRDADGQELEEFECPFCYVLCEIESSNAWRNHVLKDLEPYMCTFLRCSQPDQMYASRLEWQQHEIEEHKVEWFCNFKGHDPYKTQIDFTNHMLEEHSSSVSSKQLPSLLQSFQRPSNQRDSCCPLCLQIPRSLEGHVARHHKQLALFAIPRLHYTRDGSENESILSKDALGHSSSGISSRNASLQKDYPDENLPEMTEVDFPKDMTIESDEPPDSVDFDYTLLRNPDGTAHWLNKFSLTPKVHVPESVPNEEVTNALLETNQRHQESVSRYAQGMYPATTLAAVSAMIEVCERLGAYIQTPLAGRRKDEVCSWLIQQNTSLIKIGSSVKNGIENFRHLSLSNAERDEKWENISRLVLEFHTVPEQLETLLKEAWPPSKQALEPLRYCLAQKSKEAEYTLLRERVLSFIKDFQLLMSPGEILSDPSSGVRFKYTKVEVLLLAWEASFDDDMREKVNEDTKLLIELFTELRYTITSVSISINPRIGWSHLERQLLQFVRNYEGYESDDVLFIVYYNGHSSSRNGSAYWHPTGYAASHSDLSDPNSQPNGPTIEYANVRNIFDSVSNQDILFVLDCPFTASAPGRLKSSSYTTGLDTGDMERDIESDIKRASEITGNYHTKELIAACGGAEQVPADPSFTSKFVKCFKELLQIDPMFQVAWLYESLVNDSQQPEPLHINLNRSPTSISLASLAAPKSDYRSGDFDEGLLRIDSLYLRFLVKQSDPDLQGLPSRAGLPSNIDIKYRVSLSDCNVGPEHLLALNRIRRRERYIMCVVLANAMLQLNHVPWLGGFMVAETVYFYLPKATNDLHPCPYVLALGIRFLEIELAMPVREAQHQYFPGIDLSPSESLDQYIPVAREMLKRFLFEASSRLTRAVTICIDPGEFMYAFAGFDFQLISTTNDQTFRNLVHDLIVKPLEQELENGWGIKVDDLKSTHTPPSPINSELHSPEESHQNPGQVPLVALNEHTVTKASLNMTDPERANAADAWFEELSRSVHPLLSSRNNLFLAPSEVLGHAGRVRIAIIDTGMNLPKSARIAYGGRIKGYKSWIGSSETRDTHQDNNGHGTNSASLLLKVAPEAEIYVARVFFENDSDGTILLELFGGRMKQAILHAVDQWEVDIISMSCAFEHTSEDVSQALSYAYSKNVVLFAPGSNNRGNVRNAWPARSREVICINAADGHGNRASLNPEPPQGNTDFCILGEDVLSISPDGMFLDDDLNKVRRSGASVATAIAAGIAANILGFSAEHHRASDEQGILRRLHSKPGICQVFHLMAEERDGQKFIIPWTLMNAFVSTPDFIMDSIIEQLRDL